MTRWFGLALLCFFIPLFFFIRVKSIGKRLGGCQRFLNPCVFLGGFWGFCLLVFGGMGDATAFLLTWCAAAWLYNR
jgi:hypothetical protein